MSCPKGWHVAQEIGSVAGKLFLSKPLRGGCVIECKIEQFNFQGHVLSDAPVMISLTVLKCEVKKNFIHQT